MTKSRNSNARKIKKPDSSPVINDEDIYFKVACDEK